MLSGEVARQYPAGAGAHRLFAGVAPVLRQGDLVFGNLETPLCGDASERSMFLGDPAMVEFLASAGFNVLSLANNHILEHGPESLRETAERLRAGGIAVLGAGESQRAARQPVVLEKNGLRIGFLGFARTLQRQPDDRAPGFTEWDEDLAVAAVRDLKDRVDCVVVSIHIGYMWVDYPKPEVREAADRLLGAGAHVVLMHHAHVLQGFKAEEGRLVVYNLGNFVADVDEGELGGHPLPDREKESAIFLVEIDRQGVVAVDIVPIIVTEDYRVVVAPEDRARQIADRLDRIAEEIRSGAYREGFARQRAELNTENILAWVSMRARKRQWRELARGMLRFRPEHVGMLGRFALRRLEELWKRH
jgi:poly-gamma-glutamate synthesis protein (capsule biosynthesis protein)